MPPPSLEPIEYRSSRLEAAAGMFIMSIVVFPCGLLLPFGLVLAFHPIGSVTLWERIQGVAMAPFGGWLAYKSWPYFLRASTALLRPEAAVRLDATGITVNDQEPRLFRWSEGPTVRFSRRAAEGFIEVSSRAGFSAKVTRVDVAAPLEEVYKRVEAFRDAYSAKA